MLISRSLVEKIKYVEIMRSHVKCFTRFMTDGVHPLQIDMCISWPI